MDEEHEQENLKIIHGKVDRKNENLIKTTEHLRFDLLDYNLHKQIFTTRPIHHFNLHKKSYANNISTQVLFTTLIYNRGSLNQLNLQQMIQIYNRSSLFDTYIKNKYENIN